MFTSIISAVLLFVTTATSTPFPTKRATTNNTLSCSETSFRHLLWKATDLSFNSSITFTTPSHAVSSGFVSFRLANNALNYTLSCSASDTRMWEFFYGDRWFPCVGPEGISSNAEFRYTNRGESRYLATVNAELEVRQRWMCDDGEYPIIFNATGSANLTLGCTINKTYNTNWSMGQTHSTQSISCAKQDWPLTLTEMSAIA